MIDGKKILLGVTGSIAAYKSALLCRLFVKAGADVRVLMTPAATDFITPLTLSTLSRHAVTTDLFSEEGWNNHVEHGLWADAMVIAPATANTLARLAAGLCDNMISATYLSARCPVFVAPAMDLDMWRHPATRRNLDLLQTDGVHLLPVGKGELASGLVGEGRMAEPEDILTHLRQYFGMEEVLLKKKVLITAGPTREPIDPVRFLSNRSSGKMGVALAEACAEAGATVELILGPGSAGPPNHPQIHTTRVQTAEEMYEAARRHWPKVDAGIMAAAVADYRPHQVLEDKLKKSSGPMQLELVRTPDIAAALGKEKRPGQVLVGFALETEREKENAQSKLKRKNFDFIVLNSLRDDGAGFQTDTNKVTLFFQAAEPRSLPLKSKKEVARDICAALAEQLKS